MPGWGHGERRQRVQRERKIDSMEGPKTAEQEALEREADRILGAGKRRKLGSIPRRR